ncbi:MAG: efflux RND transporter periplasmic adaptor subunit [Rhodospirillaceae bacterium]|jgi:membrane fusion protein, multidrug efflux system|nr:efflux RND transporter periplasmic adaptor subunit [Rhodospirillaceae bacterium]
MTKIRHGNWRAGAILIIAASWADLATAQNAPGVIVAPAMERDVTPQFEHVGRVEAVETVELRARVQGFLEKRNFREGSEIEKGALMFIIEKAPYEVVVQERKADLAVAEATRKNAESDFKRKSSLVKRGNVSRASLDESRSLLEGGRATVLKAQSALREARLNLSYTEIRSPIAGKISRARYSVGNLVGSNSDPLATVTSVDPVYVTIAISEKQLINARKKGIDIDNPPVAPSLILTDGSRYPHGGNFDYLAPSVDQTTDTVVARAVFPNPKRVLLPGQFVTVIVREKIAVTKLAVPQSAVQQDSRGHFVLVVGRKNKVELRRITVGPQIERDWVVENGLASGERVITQGLQKVRPDMIVNPVLRKGS